MHLARLTTVIAFVVASFIGGAARAADKYALDPMHTFVVFKITDMGYAHVVGWFTAVAGKLTFDPADITKSSLNVTIKTASIDTHFAQRNKDLMSPDFLNVAEFPEMTFKSTSVEKTGDKTGRVTGELTLLGVTKPVTMDVTFNKVAPNPFNKNTPTAGFEAHTVIKRSDFGMKAEIPNIGDEVDISIDSQAPKMLAGQGPKASGVLSPPDANSAFVGRALEGMLDELGPTTMVRCGVLTPNSARRAGAPL